jgi:aspartyl-tRNA(Asn)/glutamyl-tRNA(Gln) amidotransferase subunit A
MIELTACELLGQLSKGEFSAESLTSAYLDTINRKDPEIAAFLQIYSESALEDARAVDRRRALGGLLGPLAGIPVAVKDVLCVAGRRTTCGSRILEPFIPPYDAHVIARLQAADAVLIGKTNMDEFAMGSSTENSAFQTTRNPWDTDRIPGGSSGGSAAAVAAGMAPLALGSDTGGSIRQPACMCGVVGMKPTYGRVSRYGLVAFASSLDQVGPLSRDVADAALLLQVIAGYDPRDSTSVEEPVPDYRANLDSPVRPLTIGVAPEHFGEGLDPEVEKAVLQALAVYKELGATVKEITLPHSPYAVAAYYLVATGEASSNLARYDGVHFGHRARSHENLIDLYTQTRTEGFGPEVKRRIMLGTFALSSGYREAYYVKALQVRRLIKNDYDQAFAQCDAIIGPVSPTPAFKIRERIDDPLAMYLADIYTIGANLAGIPGISIPCGFTKTGLPIGLQIVAPPFAEERILRIARMHERATNWHKRRPSFISQKGG